MKHKILSVYPHFEVVAYSSDYYVADYTLQTNSIRQVEIHTVKPVDIDSFEIKNARPTEICTVVFDNHSFVDTEDKTLSQCECMNFPNVDATLNPWILFLELKYSERKNAVQNLNKAKSQLFATLHYFKANDLISNEQICYLIVSLPKQNNTPFENFVMTPTEVTRLKRDENIIFRGTNSITIRDAYRITV